MRRHLTLGTFLKADGDHLAAWRHPSATTKGGIDIQAFVEGARIAERGKLDFIFMGDVAAPADLPTRLLARTSWFDKLEPLSVLTALACVTERIGLVSTATTTYNEPYALARRLASLDHITSGRAGWNLVTSMNHSDAMNYGHQEHAPLAERYDRAREFLSVARGLWDTWTDGSFVRDKAAGTYFRETELPCLSHKGRYFAVRGPLDMSRPPQGHIPVVLAGTSEEGKSLAAAAADMTFTSQQNFEAAKAFYAEMKGRVAKAGRNPDEFVILNGFQAIVGESVEAARAKFDELQSLLDVEMALTMLTTLLGGIDLSVYPLDEPVPPLPPAKGMSSRRDMLLDVARREGLTLRQLALRVAGGRGHYTFFGTGAMIADEMERWFRAPAVDGFLVLMPLTPDSLSDFVDQVVPELRKRGLFRDEYEGVTLRQHLGLPRPPVPFGTRIQPHEDLEKETADDHSPA